MGYVRVIPRDLFNEASLLKCYGQLYLKLEALPAGHGAEVTFDEYEGVAFEAYQDQDDGSLHLSNVALFVHGRRVKLRRPLNSRRPWPLYAYGPDDDEEADVFTDVGDLSEDFLILLRKVGVD